MKILDRCLGERLSPGVFACTTWKRAENYWHSAHLPPMSLGVACKRIDSRPEAF